MGFLDFLKSPSVIGRQPNTFDFFVEELGRNYERLTKPISDFLTPESKEEALNVGLIPVEIAGKTRYLDPIGGIGSMRNVAKNAVKKTAKQATSRTVQLLKGEAIKRRNTIERPFKRAGLVEKYRNQYLKDIGRDIRTGVSQRARQLERTVDPTPRRLPAGRTPIQSLSARENPGEFVKIRRTGSGDIRIRSSELEVLKSMKDLKPRRLERTFENPLRVFEEMGDEVKELIYRPIKMAEKATFESKEVWKKAFRSATAGLKNKSSRKIAKFALSLEDDGRNILQKMGEKVEPLNVRERAAYEYMREAYDNLLEGLNRSRRIIGKDPINRRPNYFTHIRDMSTLEELGFSMVGDNIDQLIARGVHRNAPAFRFARRRTGGLEKVELDAFNVFNKYQEQALEHINMSPAITKARELTRTVIPDPLNRAKFNLADHAPVAHKYITEWLDFVAGQKPATILPKVIDRTILKLNKNVAFAVLSGNIRSALIQPSAIINTVTEITPKYTGIGIKRLIRDGSEFAIENSNVLKGRQFETAIKDAADNLIGKTGRIKQAAGQSGIQPLQVLDQLTAQASWYGAYDYAKIKLGRTAKQAANFADDVVVRTQASAARSDIAPIQRTTLGKTATLFQTFVINDFNRIFKDVLGVGVKRMTRSQKFRKTITYATAVSLWNVLMEDVLGIPTPLPRPIKAAREEGLAEAGRELASQVPVIGGKARFGSSAGGALVDVFSDILDKADGKYTSASWWELAGKLLGVAGTNQLKKTIRSVKGLQDGYTVTTYDGKRRKIKITDPVDQVRALLFGLYSTKTAERVRSGERP